MLRSGRNSVLNSGDLNEILLLGRSCGCQDRFTLARHLCIHKLSPHKLLWSYRHFSSTFSSCTVWLHPGCFLDNCLILRVVSINFFHSLDSSELAIMWWYSQFPPKQIVPHEEVIFQDGKIVKEEKLEDEGGVTWVEVCIVSTHVGLW